MFTLWLNSLEVDPAVYDLFENLRDGVVILQAFDKVIPGSVVWRRVSKPKVIEQPVELAEGEEPKPPLSRFKMVENTNYAVDLAKANRMQIVGIQGADIVDGSKTLTLGLVWQLMRRNIVQTLASLSASRGGREVTDGDIVKWANETAKKGGKSSSMKSFKDPNNKNAVIFLDVLDALKPGYVDYSLVTQGRNDEECRLNGGHLALPWHVSVLTCSHAHRSMRPPSQARHLDCEKARSAHLPHARGYRRAARKAHHDFCRKVRAVIRSCPVHRDFG